MTYRAHVGERTFDIVFEEGVLHIDDIPTTYTFERLSEHTYTLLLDGESIPLVIAEAAGGKFCVTIAGRQTEVLVKDEKALLLERYGLADDSAAAALELHAPMPGLVLNVLVEAGQEVQEGDGLVVLEAMKMENELRAAASGTIKSVHVTAGEAVGKNALLLEFA